LGYLKLQLWNLKNLCPFKTDYATLWQLCRIKKNLLSHLNYVYYVTQKYMVLTQFKKFFVTFFQTKLYLRKKNLCSWAKKGIKGVYIKMKLKKNAAV